MQNDSEKPTLDRLFDTAATLFWQKGYAATTTREIAAAIGIQQASLYYHVKSKEDLLYQLGVSSLERMHAEVLSAVGESGRPLDRIGVFIDAHLDTLLKDQTRHVAVLSALPALAPDHLTTVLALRKRYATFVKSLVEDAQKAGVLRTDIPAEYLYLALLNLLNWTVVWFRPGARTSIREVAAMFRTVFLDGAGTRQSRAPLELPAPRRKRSAKPKAAEEKSTPERMLDRAAELFAVKGYAAASTREIATGLGMRKASLYYHISTKEDLLYAICQSSLENIRRDMERAIAGAEKPGERVRALIVAHVDSLLRHQTRHSTALAEMHFLSSERRAQVLTWRDGYEELVRTVLAEAQAAGALRKEFSPKLLGLALLGLLNRSVFWFRPNGPLAPDHLGHMLADIFLTGTRTRREKLPADR